MKYLSVSFGVLGFLLTGCGSDSSSPQAEPDAVVAATDEPQSEGFTLAVNAMAELPACNEETKGQTYFVRENQAIYACIDTEWEVAIENEKYIEYVSCTTPGFTDVLEADDVLRVAVLSFTETNKTISATLSAKYVGSFIDSFSVGATIQKATINALETEFTVDLPEPQRSILANAGMVLVADPWFMVAINYEANTAHFLSTIDETYPVLGEATCKPL